MATDCARDGTSTITITGQLQTPELDSSPPPPHTHAGIGMDFGPGAPTMLVSGKVCSGVGPILEGDARAAALWAEVATVRVHTPQTPP